MLTQASDHYSQLRAGWGPCPDNTINRMQTFWKVFTWLTIIGEKQKLHKYQRFHLDWKRMNWWVQCLFLLQIKRAKIPQWGGYEEIVWYNWKCTLTSPPLSQMSLTCRGRPVALYLLLHEPQPLNSCWQSCLSPHHPLTWWANMEGKTEKSFSVWHISVKKKSELTL